MQRLMPAHWGRRTVPRAGTEAFFLLTRGVRGELCLAFLLGDYMKQAGLALSECKENGGGRAVSFRARAERPVVAREIFSSPSYTAVSCNLSPPWLNCTARLAVVLSLFATQ
ncbi:unnamed protein product [Scytosiphon promiscuus]